MMPFRVFIGYDKRQPLAFTICQASVQRHATQRVTIEPLILDRLPLKRRGLTDFTYSRWLVPFLCDFKGGALFIDPDSVMQGDVTELERITDPYAAVSVVKGKLRFEWASMMYFQCDNAICHQLTPDYVDDATRQPASFDWCPPERIGDLTAEWNHLVLYDNPSEGEQAKFIHYTAGIPCWKETERSPHAKRWHQEMRAALETCSWKDLMGNSVHRPAVEALNKKIK